MKAQSEMALVLHGVTKDYGQGRGVFDINIEVQKGEAMGFLGPNGAGKTTTMRILMGFIHPQRGSASILGFDCFRDAARIQACLGYLPGEMALMDDMRGEDFLRFIAELKEIRDFSRARDLIARFELNTAAHIKRMSKGMKQKLGIVSALMADAQVYLLDEPTSGLDPLMQGRFVQLIAEEKARGKTILLSSHQFEEIERTCDRATILRAGHIAAVEDVTALKKGRQRCFEITFHTKQDAEAFAMEWPGANCREERVALALTGGVDDLIKRTAKYRVCDLNVRPLSLEDLFMQYYGGERDE